MEHPVGLTFGDFVEADEPFGLFDAWFKAAKAGEPRDPDAASLATVDSAGLPNVRMVLIKAADSRGFVFYTNAESVKGAELKAQPKAALLLHWKSLGRQVRVRGNVEPASPAESDAYFASRPREAQIGAWASQQSRSLESRAVLEKEAERLAKKFDGKSVPRPPHWHGFRIVPLAIEFWAEGPHRLHNRLVFTRAAPEAKWQRARLYP
jgi:pyridoxamine 5'-phosphate oxidase